MEFVEAALHETDDELCHDEIERLFNVVRMSQKRIWRRLAQLLISFGRLRKDMGSAFDEMNGRALAVACLRMIMTSWCVAKGRTAACVRLITRYLSCSTNDARLLWATREVHGGSIVHGVPANSISCEGCHRKCGRL